MKQVWLRLGGTVVLLAGMIGALCACQSVQDSKTVVYYGVNLQAGDLDGNEKIDLDDVTLLRKHLIRELTLSATQQAKADMDGDGKLTAKDVYLLVKSIPKMEPGRPDIGPL